MILYRVIRDSGELVCKAVKDDYVIATGTWTRLPGPREIYWSHGLNVDPNYRRRGIATNIREILWDNIGNGAMVMLSVAHGNMAQHEHITKNGYTRAFDNEEEGYCVYFRVKINESMKEVP